MRILKLLGSSLANVGQKTFFWTALYVFDYVFDLCIYTSVVAFYGIIVGGTIMWATSFVLDVSLMHIYNYFNKDVFGFETITEWREYDGKSLWKLLRRKIVGMSDPLVFVFITIIENPFLATAYMRKTDKSRKGMNKRDWKFFLVSFVISNLAWTLFSGWVSPITKVVDHAVVGMFVGVYHLVGF